MDISELLDETVPLKMDWKGKEVNFDARKASFTPSLIKGIANPEEYARVIAENVTDWDLTDRSPDKKWPLDEASVAKLPVGFLSAMIDRIGETWAGDEKKKEASASGSAAAAK
jgi:hypothetical protein